MAQQKNEGEGNKSADKQYREGATGFARRGDALEKGLEAEREVEQNPRDPFLELLAEDTLSVARSAEPTTVTQTKWIASFSSAAGT